jgi:hypothetical protein
MRSACVQQGAEGFVRRRGTYRFGHPLQSVAALNGKLLVEINTGRTYDDLSTRSKAMLRV